MAVGRPAQCPLPRPPGLVQPAHPLRQERNRHVGSRSLGRAPKPRTLDGRHEGRDRRRRRRAGGVGRPLGRRVDGDPFRRHVPRARLGAGSAQLLRHHAEARRLSDRAPVGARRRRLRMAVRGLGHRLHPRRAGAQRRRRPRAAPVARPIAAPLGQPRRGGRDDPMGAEHRRARRAGGGAGPDARLDAGRRPVRAQRPWALPRRAHPVGAFRRAAGAGLPVLRRTPNRSSTRSRSY